VSVIEIPGDELEQMSAMVPRLRRIPSSTGIESLIGVRMDPFEIGDPSLEGSMAAAEQRYQYNANHGARWGAAPTLLAPGRAEGARWHWTADAGGRFCAVELGLTVEVAAG
jgi:hypothetical protein